MANQSNIVVKRSDTTTDLLFEAVVGSSGDKSPAIWKSADGAAPAYKAELRLATMDNGPKTARKCDLRFKYPITVTGTDGITRQTDLPQFSVQGIISEKLNNAQRAEVVHEFVNLLHSAHIRDQLITMFAAT